MMNVCILILAHKDISYLYDMIKKNSSIRFYVHMDKKATLVDPSIDNLKFIDERFDVNWAGFSMIDATLSLFNYALYDDHANEYFHLISAEDICLTKNLKWKNDLIYMNCFKSPAHNYRLRFNAPHADTKYQRTFLGKLITLFFRVIDKIFYNSKKCGYFGSQWFSIRRKELETILTSISCEDISFFRKKLCPDEHFFQYLVVKNSLLEKIAVEGNKRFIVFDKKYKRGNNPIYLSKDQIIKVKNKDFWFARKVKPDLIFKFYND